MTATLEAPPAEAPPSPPAEGRPSEAKASGAKNAARVGASKKSEAGREAPPAGTAWIAKKASGTPAAEAPEPAAEAPIVVVAAAPTPAETLARMSGARRSAVLLIALGVETASKVLPLLADPDVEAVSVEIARTRNVPPAEVEAVLAEFHDLAVAQGYVSQGGAAFARQMLQAALGDDRAEEVMMKVEASLEVSAFHLLHTVETEPLVAFLAAEHPQTTALILTQLNPRKAAELVGALPGGVQSEVVFRIATMATPAPEVVREVEEIIRTHIGSGLGAAGGARGGVAKVAEILSATTRSAERLLMGALRERSDELATAVKALMFVFDDLVLIDDRDLQRVLTGVDSRDLALALKGSPDAFQSKVFANVSERVAATLRDEIELLGAVAVADVDEAQARMLASAQEMEGRGEVTLSRAPVRRA